MPSEDQAGKVIECRESGNVRAFQYFETLRKGAIRRVVSEFWAFFGCEPSAVKVLGEGGSRSDDGPNVICLDDRLGASRPNENDKLAVATDLDQGAEPL